MNDWMDLRRTPSRTRWPGVLSEINRVVSHRQINIAAQYLQTHANVGYVVIDIDAEHSDLALAKLADVPGTLRSRVLF